MLPSLKYASPSYIVQNYILYPASIHYVGLSVQISMEVSAERHWRCIFVSILFVIALLVE